MKPPLFEQYRPLPWRRILLTALEMAAVIALLALSFYCSPHVGPVT